ncbi:MAG: hypothetical protein JSV43_07045 [Methanobacteriota archaeon]|nr:MAG: hypothetical protein JSV43_07045 [Euryarchaeota archaeon]
MVNANHYADKRDVYLNGGPGAHAPPWAAGLPDGNYYFQVTDPSGKKLLSMDPVYCREFRVEDGVFAEFVSIGRDYIPIKGNGNGNGKGGNGDPVPCHIPGWEHGQHDLGWNLWANSLTIQLMPYKDTPNKGGVYKVWATPTGFFVGDPNDVDAGYSPGNFHGFIPAHSKTDNFKAKRGPPKPTPEIEICKFEDVNGNGEWDVGEPGVSGWAMYVTDPLDVTNTYYTGEDGCIVIDASVDGIYTIEEETQSGWSISATIVDGMPISPTTTVDVDVNYRMSLRYSVAFGNFHEFRVSGCKYNDLNGDGNFDGGEPTIPGWTVTLYKKNPSDGWDWYAETTTGDDGCYEFIVAEGGEFKVAEEDRSGWVHTSQTSFTFTGTSGVDQGPFDFYNFQCFKVSGYKYEDMNGDGDWDEGDDGIEGWIVTLYKKDGLGAWQVYATTTTDSNGKYEFCVCEGGEFKVAEEDRSGWVHTSPSYFEFTAVSGVSRTFDFFNFELGEVCGKKWYDSDRDGTKDGDEDYIEGFKVELWKDGSLFATDYTDSTGEFCFYELGPGSYEIKEIMPLAPGDYWVWASTYPAGGTWTFELTSGFFKCDANFGNIVEYTGGLTWGYWKTHTGFDSPPRDPAYDLLPDYQMSVDVETSDGDYLVETDEEAKWIFDGAGDYPANCAGTCRSLFRAQLLALHMNWLKFGDDFFGATYIYQSDSYSGWTVEEIYDEAIWKLINEDSDYDFTSFQETLDRINNNGHYDPGSHVLVMPEAPPIVYP